MKQRVIIKLLWPHPHTQTNAMIHPCVCVVSNFEQWISLLKCTLLIFNSSTTHAFVPNLPRCQKLLQCGQYFIALLLAHVSTFTAQHIDCSWWTERFKLTKAGTRYAVMISIMNYLHFCVSLPLMGLISSPILTLSDYASIPLLCLWVIVQNRLWRSSAFLSTWDCF